MLQAKRHTCQGVLLSWEKMTGVQGVLISCKQNDERAKDNQRVATKLHMLQKVLWISKQMTYVARNFNELLNKRHN